MAVSEVGPEPVVLSESEAKESSPMEASGPSSKQDEPSRGSDTSETSSQSEDRSQRPSAEDTKKVCVCVCVCVHVCVVCCRYHSVVISLLCYDRMISSMPLFLECVSSKWMVKSFSRLPRRLLMFEQIELFVTIRNISR